MKKEILLLGLLFLLGFQVSVNAQDLKVSDVQNIGCIDKTKTSENSMSQSISLLKEGNILSVHLYNYMSCCDTEDFKVTPNIIESNNGGACSVSVSIESIGENIADCICPYNISFTIHDLETNSFNLSCWWFKGQVNLTEGEQLILTNEYYPEGTKWTEIRLDTLKYDSWYSKDGDEWVPNFETVEYYVKGTYKYEKWLFPSKCVYTNGPEWTDSLTLYLFEDNYYAPDMGVLATVPAFKENGTPISPEQTYYFDWCEGMMISFWELENSKTTINLGKIEEIKEGDFGGIKSLKYADVNGVRVVQGIGVTTWNDGECLFGPIKPYQTLASFKEGFPQSERNYRSMLVHFERNGEVLYDMWPKDIPSGIETPSESKYIYSTLPNSLYDLQGRMIRGQESNSTINSQLSPVNSLRKGIYIQNGKKIAVK